MINQQSIGLPLEFAQPSVQQDYDQTGAIIQCSRKGFQVQKIKTMPINGSMAYSILSISCNTATSNGLTLKLKEQSHISL